MRVAEYAGIVLGVVALVGAIAFLSHHRSGSVRPAGSGTVAGHGQTRGPFAVARGWLTVGGETVWAFDPADSRSASGALAPPRRPLGVVEGRH